MPLFWWGTIEWYSVLTDIQTYTDVSINQYPEVLNVNLCFKYIHHK